MNGKIRKLIKKKNLLFQCQRKSGNYAILNSITKMYQMQLTPQNLNTMSVLQSSIKKSIKQFHKPIKIVPKTYWKILKKMEPKFFQYLHC